MAIKKTRTTLAAAAAATALSGAAAEADGLRTQAAELVADGVNITQTVTNASESVGRRLGVGRFERKIAPVATQVEAAYARYHEQFEEYVAEQAALAQEEEEAREAACAALAEGRVLDDPSVDVEALECEEEAVVAGDAPSPEGSATESRTPNAISRWGRRVWNMTPAADIVSGDVDRGTLQSIAGIGVRVAGASVAPLIVGRELANGADGYQQGRSQAHGKYIVGVQQLVAEGEPGFGSTTGFVTEITEEGAVVHQFELAGDLRSNNGEGLYAYSGLPQSLAETPEGRQALQTAADEAHRQAMVSQIQAEMLTMLGDDFFEIPPTERLERLNALEARINALPDGASAEQVGEGFIATDKATAQAALASAQVALQQAISQAPEVADNDLDVDADTPEHS